MLLYIVKIKLGLKLPMLVMTRVIKVNILEDFDECIDYLLTG
jgi:hypothetical protein